MEFALETPIAVQKFFKASGVHPLLLKPEIVGILGSSHPSTTFSSTSCLSFLLLITVFVMFNLANSICLGVQSISHSLTTQS
ncbi:hypothetical protein D3C73_1535490 [compost metagenome]